MRERVGAGRRDAQARRLQKCGERSAERGDLVACLADVRADLRAGLDDRLHHLPLDLIAVAPTRRREERLDVALELTLGIDDLELLLDADRQVRDVRDLHAAPSTRYVGTTLPAPAGTVSGGIDAGRVSTPPTRPQKRYGSQSTLRSRKCTRSSTTGNGSRGTATFS